MLNTSQKLSASVSLRSSKLFFPLKNSPVLCSRGEFESIFDPCNFFQNLSLMQNFFSSPPEYSLTLSTSSYILSKIPNEKKNKQINLAKSLFPSEIVVLCNGAHNNKPVQIQAEASDAENVMQMISQGGGDMWQEATPGTCVPCLPGEIEPWAECLWVWRNYRLGGRLTCLWHQRRQPRQRWRKPAVVIVHKLRRHVFEEFMRWLYCTHGGISPRGVSCPEHTTTTHRGRVGSCVCPLKHDRVRPASVSSVLHQELDLSPWTDNVRRGRVYLSGYTSSRRHPSFLPPPSTMNQPCLVGSRYLFLHGLLPEPSCHVILGEVALFFCKWIGSFFLFNRRFEVSEWWTTLVWLETRSVGSGWHNWWLIMCIVSFDAMLDIKYCLNN